MQARVRNAGMKRIYDPAFRYTPSYDTDLRPLDKVLRLDRTKAG